MADELPGAVDGQHLLARTIAHLVTSVDVFERAESDAPYATRDRPESHLHRIHIDPNVDPSLMLPFLLARQINVVSRAEPENPRGLVVVDPGKLQSVVRPDGLDDVLLIATDEAIKYRTQHPRTLVMPERAEHVGMTSVENAFAPIFYEDFPSPGRAVSPHHGLVEFAAQAVGVVWGAHNPPRSRAELTPVIESLEYLLDFLHSFYAELERKLELSVKGHVLWFWHVIRGLEECAKAFAGADPDEMPEISLWPSFSLPRPDSGSRYSHKPKDFADACISYWGTSDDVTTNLAIISGEKVRRSQGILQAAWRHPMSGLDLQQFDVLARSFNGHTVGPLLAMALVDQGNPDRSDAFGSFMEEEYFLPRSKTPVLDVELVVEYSEDSVPLWAAEDFGGLLICERTARVPDGGKMVLRSDEVRFRVDVGGSDDGASPSAVSIEPKDKGLSFVELSKSSASGVVEITGYFQRPVTGRKAETRCPLTAAMVNLVIQLPFDGGVHRCEKKFLLVMLPDFGSGLVAWDETKEPKKKDVVLLGVDSIDDAGSPVVSNPYEWLVKEDSEYSFITWDTSADNVGAALNAVPLETIPDRRGLCRKSGYQAADGDQVSSGEVLVDVKVGDGNRQSPQSPVIAAIYKVNPDVNQPLPADAESLRGAVELKLGDLITRNEWTRSLGHIVLPVDRPGLLDDLVQSSTGSCWMPGDLRQNNVAMELDRVPTEMIESEAAERFRAAFEALCVGDRIIRKDEDGSGWLQLISKTKWRHLHGLDVLDEYLNSYRAMVEYAVSLGDERAVVWAAYPFSVELWESKNNSVLRSVLLSPLHPLRLAWLASIEDNLFHANNARRLAGVVDSWNIPHFGPDEEEERRLLAMPLDPGSEQIFLGWSQLVKRVQEGPLESPERAGSYTMPENSSSGINGQTVRHALRDFCRVHSYMPTIAVDLASSTKLTKLTQVDRAVVEAFVGDGAIATVAGLRVFDSLNRIGPAVDLKENEGSGPRVTWQRYSDAEEADVSNGANVRILQDSGVAVKLRIKNGSGDGTLGAVPFRRFETPQTNGNLDIGTAQSRPTMGFLADENPFNAALRMIETAGLGDRVPEINMRIQAMSPLLRDSEWTVSGETMVTPAALATMVSRSGRMLWEWNPPFMVDDPDLNRQSRVDRRPYFSIGRIPDVFKSRIREKLEVLLGRTPTSQELDDVLKVLGTRGIGLSRLLAIGGSHLHGAFGFYLTLKLLEGSGSGVGRFVLPIDACNGFLEVLAGRSPKKTSRRADLLVLDVRSDRLVLAPIEIKFYNFDSPRPSLPEPDSAALNDARAQALETARLLEEVAQEWDRLRADDALKSDAMLAAHALASLVEAAMKLDPEAISDRPGAVTVVDRILRGDYEICPGRPVVAYYQMCAPVGGVNAQISIRTAGSDVETAGFVADPQAVLRGLLDNDGDVADVWAGTLRWATECEGEEAGNSHGPSTEGSKPGPEPEVSGDDVIDVVPDLPDRAPVTDTPSEREPDHPTEERGSGETTEVAVPATGGGAAGEPVLESGISGAGVRFAVGRLLDSVRDTDATFWPSNTRLNQLNIGVVGDLGTGKTQLLKALVHQLRSECAANQTTPLSVLILDYKRDYQDEDFLSAVGGIALVPQNIPLDVFGIQGERTALAVQRRAMAFVDVVSRIFKGIGPRQKSSLGRAVRTLLSNSDKSPTMLQVLDAYRAEIDDVDSVVGVLENFVYSEVFHADVDQLSPLSEILGSQVVTVNLAALENDQNLKNALVALFLNQYYEYMLRLTKWPVRETPDANLRALNSYLLVDEATNIMKYKFDVLSQILLQGREFGVGVMLSSQFLTHFEVSGVDYAEPLRSWFIHKVPNVTKQQLARLGIPNASDADAQRISQMGIHEAYYVSEGFEGKFIKGNPFYSLIKPH